MDVRRGQVWWWNCPSHDRHHIQNGARPVVIVSNNVCNRVSEVVTVVPFTSSVKKPYPQHAPVVLPDGVSVAMGEQLTSIPISELGRCICTLSDFQMEAVDRAIKVQLSFIDANYPIECEGE